MPCSVVSLERATVSLVRWMERHHAQSTSIRALLPSPGLWDRWFPLLLPSAPTLCGGCHGVALRTGRYPTRRSVVAPRDEVKHPYPVACDARRWEGTYHHAGETAHACVAEASRSPSPSVSDADVWVSDAQRGCQARLNASSLILRYLCMLGSASHRLQSDSVPWTPQSLVGSIEWKEPPHALRALPRPASPSPPWSCGRAQRASAPCPCLRAVGSALLCPRPRAGGSLGRAGYKAHSTVVHGSAMAHAAEAMPPRLPGHHRLAHERSHRYTCLRSRPRTGQCSG